MLLDGVSKFEGFGPCRFSASVPLGAGQVELARERRATRRLLRAGVPSSPGVYGMIDAGDELVYVGKSKSLCHRLLSYFSAAAEGVKAGRIARRAVRIAWEPHAHELAALLRELELIRRFRPRLNVQGQPGRRGLWWLCLGRGPAPPACLAPQPLGGGEAAFGPFPAGRRARNAVRLLNECFGLRDCPGHVPMAFSDQRELFPAGRAARCLRHDLGTCPAPCAGACTRREYDERVRAARRFLEGDDTAVLDRLEADMQRAAAAERFEQAAFLRDRWQALDAVARHLARLRDVRRRYSFVYPVTAEGGQAVWHLVRHGDVAAACPAPHDPSSARECMALLRRVYGRRGAAGGARPAEDLEVVLLVSAWFRRHPEEIRRAISPRAARRRCRLLSDGGTAGSGAPGPQQAADACLLLKRHDLDQVPARVG